MLNVIAGNQGKVAINTGQNQNHIENESKVVKCKYCAALLELDSKEIENKRFICPICNKENIL